MIAVILVVNLAVLLIACPILGLLVLLCALLLGWLSP
jgi:hypothetical protein